MDVHYGVLMYIHYGVWMYTLVSKWCVDVLWYVDTHHCLWIVCICGVQCGFDNLCLTVVTLCGQKY